jgi:hypothetical protein
MGIIRKQRLFSKGCADKGVGRSMTFPGERPTNITVPLRHGELEHDESSMGCSKPTSNNGAARRCCRQRVDE